MNEIYHSALICIF